MTNPPADSSARFRVAPPRHSELAMLQATIRRLREQCRTEQLNVALLRHLVCHVGGEYLDFLSAGSGVTGWNIFGSDHRLHRDRLIRNLPADVAQVPVLEDVVNRM